MQTPNIKNDNHENQSRAGHTQKPETEDALLNLYNPGLKDETWQKIVKALAARGFPIKDEDLQVGKQ